MIINMQYFWEKIGWETEDLHLVQLNAAPFQRGLPQLLLAPGLFIIRGPRQIGKSSWLKLLLFQLCQQGLSKKVFFASCENLRDHLDLKQLLEEAQFADTIFLDEVTFVKDWSRAIKHEIDRRLNLCLVLTGSNSVDLRKGADRMPGRFRGGDELFLLPMGFDEFLAARRQAGWINSDAERSLELERFFRVGGFPLAVAEAGAEASLPEKAMKTYSRWLVGDALQLGKNELYFKEVLSQIFNTSLSSLSLQKLAQRTQLGSHHTVADYLQLLNDCFALTTLYAINTDTGVPHPKKDKKLYLRDPIIYQIARQISGEEVSVKRWNEILAEAMACEFLTRRFERFGYLRTNQGEVDFFSAKKWALEIKWSREPQPISSLMKNLRLPYKQVWTPSNFFENPPQ